MSRLFQILSCTYQKTSAKVIMQYEVHRHQVLDTLPSPATPCHTDCTGLCQQRSDMSYYWDSAKAMWHWDTQDSIHTTIWSTGKMYLENYPLSSCLSRRINPSTRCDCYSRKKGMRESVKQEQAGAVTHSHLHAGWTHSTGQFTHHLWLGSTALQTEMGRGQDQLPLTQQRCKYLIEGKLTDSKGQCWHRNQ